MWWKKTVEITNRGVLVPESAVYISPLLLLPPERAPEHPSHCMLFHFALWLSINPEVTSFRVVVDAGMLEKPNTELRGSSLWVLFGNRKDRTDFSRWIKKYEKWFGEPNPMANTFLPFLPLNGKYTITIVNTPTFDFKSTGYPTSLIERWTWIIQNCRRPVYVMLHTGLAFQNENEAVAFKLRWGN